MAVDLAKVARDKELKYFLISFVDLFGVLHGQQAFIPTMLERGTEAVVVNTASAARANCLILVCNCVPSRN